MTTQAVSPSVQYPIGKPNFPKAPLSEAERKQGISDIAAVPSNLRAAVAGLTLEQLDTPYREGGWTVRQVVHHLADAHMNAFIRLKLGMTEDEPAIKPYKEQAWAELPEARAGAVETSLAIVEGVHRRMELIFREMKPADFGRRLRHPEHGIMTLDTILALYSWHGKHHVAHITELRKRKGW
jgi:uncharacterized damage-inducible protein DinB